MKAARELAVLVRMNLLMHRGFIFVMGIYPKPWLSRMEPSVKQTLADYKIKFSASEKHVSGPPKLVTALSPRFGPKRLPEWLLKPKADKPKADAAKGGVARPKVSVRRRPPRRPTSRTSPCGRCCSAAARSAY